MYTLRDNEVVHKVFLLLYLFIRIFLSCIPYGIGVLATGATWASGMEISLYVINIFLPDV